MTPMILTATQNIALLLSLGIAAVQLLALAAFAVIDAVSA
jgi:hypothetical protein